LNFYTDFKTFDDTSSGLFCERLIYAIETQTSGILLATHDYDVCVW